MNSVPKKLATSLLMAAILAGSLIFTLSADAAVWVTGYTKSNGTYVSGHYRSNPDGNPYNNWSFPGNTNPYTGVTATGNPDTYLQNYYGTSGSYSGTSSYVPPLTSSCPSNSSPNSSGGCSCNSGYATNSAKTACITMDANCKLTFGNAYAVGDQCYCSSGYTYDATSKYCTASQTLTTSAAMTDVQKQAEIARLQVLVQALLQKIAALQSNKSAQTAAVSTSIQSDKDAGISYYKSHNTCIGLEGEKYGYCLNYYYNK